MEEKEIKCKNCVFWRDKGWDGDEGIGICDNPTVIKQVALMNEDHILNFVKAKSEARMIANSLRFHSEFGCIHYNT